MAGKQSTSPFKAALKERGVTQAELARQLRTGESVVSNWARGLRPSDSNIKRIARRLKLDEAAVASFWDA